MIIGHQKIWQFLKKSTDLKKLSHAYLFCGQEKLGKKTLALEWISTIFNQSIQQLLSGGHPDFFLITPINEEIHISQIRDIIWRFSLKPSIAPFKTIIIDQAHCMNIEAQNCFLKTLEEPRGKAIIILITEYPQILLPTISSRCQTIKFYPVKKEEIENYLKNKSLSEEKIRLISEISQGRPGVAIDFLNDSKKLEIRIQREKEFNKILNSDLTTRFQCVKKISKSPELKEILNIWLFFIRNILISKLKQNQAILNQDINRLKQLQEINFLISTTNINPRLALEILMLEL